MKHEAVRTSFRDRQHALEFDLRAARSDIRARVSSLLIEGLELKALDAPTEGDLGKE